MRRACIRNGIVIRPWTDEDLNALRRFIALNLPLSQIASRLDRTPATVRFTAHRRFGLKVWSGNVRRAPAVVVSDVPPTVQHREPQWAWTSEEIASVIDLAPFSTAREIASLIGRDTAAVRRLAVALNVRTVTEH